MTKKATKKRMPAKKAATKKKAVKKTAPKKKSAKKIGSTRKSIPTKKVSGGKSSATKKRIPAKKITTKNSNSSALSKKADTGRKSIAPIEEPPNNLPPVEEKSPEIVPEENPVIAHVPGMDNKTNRKESIRHYDNHNIKLSSVSKSKMRPAGKKPLW